jgi:DNA mismatch repair ATPase MutL
MSFLRIPEEKVSLDPIKFSVEAGLVHRLGEESVSDPVLSVVELVKNSYDDDAETVNLCLRNIRTGKSTIVVTDNGNGMTDVQLQLRWMKIATSIKKPVNQ